MGSIYKKLYVKILSLRGEKKWVFNRSYWTKYDNNHDDVMKQWINNSKQDSNYFTFMI